MVVLEILMFLRGIGIGDVGDHRFHRLRELLLELNRWLFCTGKGCSGGTNDSPMANKKE